jgi:murein DD-endopeptidase MepM/ murein hydrolase activator NlpD
MINSKYASMNSVPAGMKRREFMKTIGTASAVAGGLVIGGASLLGQGKQPPAPELTVFHRARSLQPGEVVLFTIESTPLLEKLQARVFDHDFPSFDAGDHRKWTALVGIDLDTRPGRYSVQFSGKGRDGNPIAAGYPLVVLAKTFPTRKLTVDEKFVSPPATASARIQKESERVRAIFEALSPQRYWDGEFILPVPGAPISEFGKRSVYNGQPRSPHAGTDFSGATGTPIKAPNAGKVVLAANLYYSGNTVILDHGMGLYSYFGHMSAFSVHEGDQVRTGDLVGKVGATGLVTGPHLHWTVRLAGTRVDPLSLVQILKTAR